MRDNRKTRTQRGQVRTRETLTGAWRSPGARDRSLEEPWDPRLVVFVTADAALPSFLCPHSVLSVTPATQL